MSTSPIKFIMAVAGATALLMVGAIAAAAPSSAEAMTVDALPANVKIQTTDTVTVNVPASPVCAAGYTDFKAFSPGKQDAVNIDAASCSGTTLTATLSPSTSKKRNAVVKFTSTVGEKVVSTLVVHVNKARGGGKPANTGKPA